MEKKVLHFVDENRQALISGMEIVGSALLPEFSPEILAVGESSRFAADAIHDVGSEILDYGNAVDAINSLSNQPMSNKFMKDAFGKRPQDTSRETRRLTHTTHAKTSTPSSSQSGKYSMTSPSISDITSGISADLPFYDSHLLSGPADQTLTTLNVKIGKQVYPDVITPFLEQLNAKGRVRLQFAGRILSKANQRHTHLQFFRHRLSTNTSNVGAAWPTGTENYILQPSNPTVFAVGGGTTTAGYAANTTSFRDILDKTTYWAPYNKADLEDCSWNLNALKLNNTTWVSGSNPTFSKNAPMFQQNNHARMSVIDTNNRQVAVAPGGVNAEYGCYRFNAVFNKGNVLYEFMNKGLGGAKVELIVYRVKKNAKIISAGAAFGNDPTFMNTEIYNAVGAGYLETVLSRGGTDALQGRPPDQFDVHENPAFPLLPKFKRTIGMNMPFAEVSRQTFAMPSGSRRDVNIQLPGEVYDPVNVGALGAPLSDYPPIVDEGSYAIIIGVSGVKCTQEIAATATPATGFNIGDMYAKANIQFFGTYTEHLGACQYKTHKSSNMYSQGAVLTPAAPDDYAANAITMLPQSAAVRIGPTSTSGSVTSQSTLSHTFDAVPIP